MSYLPIDTNHQEMIKEERKDISMTETPKNINYARHVTPHSEESKRKISETQQARYDMMRKLIRRGQQKQMTEERVREICNETLAEYLKKHVRPITNNNRPTNINL